MPCSQVMVGKQSSQIFCPRKSGHFNFSGSSKLGPHDGSFSFAKRLHILDFSECSSILLPSSIGQLKQLKCLIAPKLQNKSLPEAIVELSKLQYLNLGGSSLISALPESIGKLSCLIYLGLSGCSGILKVPEPIGGLKSLVHLDMSNCSRITGLPGSLGNLTNLHNLVLYGCSGVKEIPESLGGLNQLQYMNSSNCNSVTRLPEAIGSLINLQYLYLGRNAQIRELLGSFQNLQNLVHLDLSGLTSLGYSFWKHLSDNMGNLTNLKYLDISSNNCYPDFISTLINPEHLFLSRNWGFVSLPECIGNLKKLYTVDLSWCYNLESLPDSIGNLKKLHTVDLSRCISLKSLPDSIGNLQNLHKLNLSHCKRLKSVPDSISKITVLKSLLIEGCSSELIDQVNSLTLPDQVNSLTLPDFTNLLKLALDGTPLSANGFRNDEDVLGELETPRGLKSLHLQDCWYQNFPSWFMDISHHLPNLVRISMDTLPKCSNLPPLGQLPNLQSLSLGMCPRVTKIDKNFCGGKGAFPRLSRFSLADMEGLEEWCTTYSVENGVEEFMFPMLYELDILVCPMLRLKPCAPTFHKFTIALSNQVISSLEEVGNSSGHLMSSSPRTSLMIRNCNIGQSLRLFHHFTALQELTIDSCGDLTSLPEGMRHLASLRSLDLIHCIGISALPKWLGDLSSLKELRIYNCNGIKSLPPSIQQLTKLQMLGIYNNPELKRWCESEENKKKLAHITKIVSTPATKLHYSFWL